VAIGVDGDGEAVAGVDDDVGDVVGVADGAGVEAGDGVGDEAHAVGGALGVGLGDGRGVGVAHGGSLRLACARRLPISQVIVPRSSVTTTTRRCVPGANVVGCPRSFGGGRKRLSFPTGIVRAVASSLV
jgi:hypothetical protein